VTYDLIADTVTVTLGGEPVELWGLGTNALPASVPGPVLEVPAGEDLIVNLENRLAVPVSLVVPGLGLGAAPVPVTDASGRVQSFSASEAPPGGVASYVFPANGKPGTYRYESGTDPALQVPMGLHGAVVVRPATTGQAYDDADGRSAFDEEAVLVFSEVDPLLHEAVRTGSFGTPVYPSTTRFAPRFFLVNGQTYDPNRVVAIGAAGERTLLRLVNAGSFSRAPSLNGVGLREIGEDGNLLRHPQDRITLLLHAGKTKDVLVQTPGPGIYTLYDRRLFVGGIEPGGMVPLHSLAGACGLGFELALLLPLVAALRARRQRGRCARSPVRPAGLRRIALVLALAAVAAPFRAVARGTPDATSPGCTEADVACALRERWGVEVVGLHVTAAGHLIDFRYRVLDPRKVLPLLDQRERAALIDGASGAVLAVPQAPKIGTLRQNTRNPRAGQVAFALFANPRLLVRAGSKVTVVIGDFKVENLTVR